MHLLAAAEEDRCRRGRAARQGAARRRTACQSHSGVRAGCKRSARPRRLWNRKPKEKAAQQCAETEQKLAEREEEERRTAGKKKRGRKAGSSRSRAGQARGHGAAQLYVDPESRIMPDS